MKPQLLHITQGGVAVEAGHLCLKMGSRGLPTMSIYCSCWPSLRPTRITQQLKHNTTTFTAQTGSLLPNPEGRFQVFKMQDMRAKSCWGTTSLWFYVCVICICARCLRHTHQVVHKQHHYCADRHAFFCGMCGFWLLMKSSTLTRHTVCVNFKKEDDNFSTTKLNLSQGKVCVVIVALFAVLVTGCWYNNAQTVSMLALQWA